MWKILFLISSSFILKADTKTFKPIRYEFKSSHFKCVIADFEKENKLDTLDNSSTEKCGTFADTQYDLDYRRTKARTDIRAYDEMLGATAYNKVETLLNSVKGKNNISKELTDEIKCYATILNKKERITDGNSLTIFVTDILHDIYVLNLFGNEMNFTSTFKDILTEFSIKNKESNHVNFANNVKYKKFLYASEDFTRYSQSALSSTADDIIRSLPFDDKLVSDANLKVIANYLKNSKHNISFNITRCADNAILQPAIIKYLSTWINSKNDNFFQTFNNYYVSFMPVLYAKTFPVNEKCKIIEKLAEASNRPDSIIAMEVNWLENVVNLNLDCVKKNLFNLKSLDLSSNEFRQKWCPGSRNCYQIKYSKIWKQRNLSCDNDTDCRVVTNSCGFLIVNKSDFKDDLDLLDKNCKIMKVKRPGTPSPPKFFCSKERLCTEFFKSRRFISTPSEYKSSSY